MKGGSMDGPNGIDISRWQGFIDWDQVKGSKAFAIIKLGGSDDGLYPDGQGVRNASEARRVGIPRGYYFYLGGVHSSGDEVKHILNLIASIGGLQAGESIWLDWEEHNTVEVAYVSEIAQGLIDAGMPKPGIYMSLSRVRGNDWKALVDKNCGLWVAAWGDNDTIPESNEVPSSDEWPFWALWQYSSNGTVPGIAGRVDLNLLSMSVEQFQKYGAGGSVPAPTPVPQPAAPAPAQQSTYSAQPGDNMSLIAAKHGMSLGLLKQLNPTAGHPARNYNNIWPGDTFVVNGSAAPAPAPTAERYDYIVPGDNLSALAARNGISLNRVIELNPNAGHPAKNYDNVWPGDRIRVA